MSYSINKVTLLGNATKAPELKYTPSGQAVCTFNMATNRGVKKNEEWVDVPTFHRIVVWAKQAEYAAKNIGKGTKVIVEGRIENRTYQDKDGITKNISEVVADNVIMFNIVKSTYSPEPDEPLSPEAQASVEVFTGETKVKYDDNGDEIPF
jgi:single-strand DNA-binding protein